MKPFILSFAPAHMRVLRSTPLNPRGTLCSTEGSSVCEAQLPGPGCRGPHGTSPVSLEEALLVESRRNKHFPGLLEPRQESGSFRWKTSQRGLATRGQLGVNQLSGKGASRSVEGSDQRGQAGNGEGLTSTRDTALSSHI